MSAPPGRQQGRRTAKVRKSSPHLPGAPHSHGELRGRTATGPVNSPKGERDSGRTSVIPEFQPHHSPNGDCRGNALFVCPPGERSHLPTGLPRASGRHPGRGLHRGSTQVQAEGRSEVNEPGGTNWCHPGVSCRQLATNPARRPRNAKFDTLSILGPPFLPGTPGRRGDLFLTVGRASKGASPKRCRLPSRGSATAVHTFAVLRFPSYGMASQTTRGPNTIRRPPSTRSAGSMRTA
jgi:hypothetical protein